MSKIFERSDINADNVIEKVVIYPPKKVYSMADRTDDLSNDFDFYATRKVSSHSHGGGKRSKTRSSSSSVDRLKKLKEKCFGPMKSWSKQKKIDIDLITTVKEMERIKHIAENDHFFEQDNKGVDYFVQPHPKTRRTRNKKIKLEHAHRTLITAGRRKK